MKKLILIFLLFWSGLSLAKKECNFFSMEEESKLQLYEQLKIIILGHFEEYLLKNQLELKDKEISIKIVVEYDPIPPHHLTNRVIVSFLGKSLDGDLIGTNPSLKGFLRGFYNGSYELYFFANPDRGRPDRYYCTYSLWQDFIFLYNLSKNNLVIGRLKTPPIRLGYFWM
jgi:hypothetical protein